MTGHGSGRATVGPASVVIELRAVNHRFLDLRTRLPGALSEHVATVEEIARKSLERGHVEIAGRVEGSLPGQVALDASRAREAFARLGELRDELAPGAPVPLELLALVPGLFVDGASAERGDVRGAVERATHAACAALHEMRLTEGVSLERDLGARLDRMAMLVGELEQRVPQLSGSLRARLAQRVSALLEGTGVALDAGRLEHEVALLAERADVSEELTRLASHLEQTRAALTREDAIGRRLEFLIQEIGREVNTLGSKVSDLSATATVIELKAELERMREQAQNVL